MSTYSLVLALHIMAVVAAFGLPLAYPLVLPYLRRNHPQAMAGVHDVQHRLNQRLTAPGTVVVLVLGAYLASEHHYWSKAWVSVALLILVTIAALGGTLINPMSRRLSELARADIEGAPPGGRVALGAEYGELFDRYMRIERLLGVLVLVAIFFMAAKPFN